MPTLIPKLIPTPGSPAKYNVGMAETFSWIPIDGAGRPLFARASYITNFEDFAISLSAAELCVESVSLKDGNSSRVADVEDAGNGLNALRVLTQDLEPQHDTVSLADVDGNIVSVTTATSSLNVNITNWSTDLSATILNQVTAVTVLNPITSVNATITNPVTSLDVTVLNPLTSLDVTVVNSVTAVTVLNPLTSLDVTVLNPVTALDVTVLNPVTALDVTVLNPVTALDATITNPVTAVTVLNPVTALDIVGELSITNLLTALIINPVTAVNATITNPVTSTIDVPTGGLPISFPNVSTDAFGRLRMSTPLTLFDSAHRFQDNNLWATLTANGGASNFNTNQGLMDLSVTTTDGSEVVRETTKTFSYQSGKGLLSMNTFVMAPSATNLRQRVGYFGSQNGFYVELSGSNLSFVERSFITGSVVNTSVSQSQWNIDKLDGNGSSGLLLDITKAQILWMDFEWLGTGTVRIGFVINGQFIHCHSFHHANLIGSTYITTASLPVRYEITNTGTTTVPHTLKQICSTVISEGGYELRGEQHTISTPITSSHLLPSAGTFYPVISLRLKTTPNRLDAIAILSNLSIMGVANGVNFQWRIVGRSVTTGGTWLSDATNSSIEYNLNGTSVASGRTLYSGFLNSSNQGSPTTTIPKADLFRFQLERDTLNNVPYEISLQVTSATDNERIFASLDWEEVTR